MAVSKQDVFAFDPLYPMYVIRASDLIQLPRFLPHSELLEKGVLTVWKPSMPGKLFVVSHQWVGYLHPDPDNVHFHTLCRILERLSRGEVSYVEDYWLHKVMFFTGGLSSKNWQAALESTFVWIDYSSIPQVSHGCGQEICRHAAQAVNSIPAYMERASVLLILTPVCQHKETGLDCNYSSWRARGWCRMELMSTMLSPRKIPAMVITGAEADPFLVHVFDGPRLCSTSAKFSCCDLGHQLHGRRISCDKQKVSAVLGVMIEAKVQQLRAQGSKCKPEMHFFNALRHIFSRGLQGSPESRLDTTSIGQPVQIFEESDVSASSRNRKLASTKKAWERAVRNARPGIERLKARLGWTAEDEEAGRKTGFCLTFCAALADDTLALRQLLAPQSPYREEVKRCLKKNYPHLAYMWKGLSPLGAAMVFASWESCELFLEAGADPFSLTWNGMSCLFGAACIGNLHNAKMILNRFPEWPINDIDMQVNVNPVLVGVISLSNKRPILEILMNAGADMNYRDKWGLTHSTLCAACTNEDCDIEVVKFILAHGGDINGRWQPHSTRWKLISKGIGFLSRWLRSRTLLELSMIDGASPLHFAAKRGDVPLIKELLECRADLCAKNKQGKTPLGVAMDFFGETALPSVVKETLNPLTVNRDAPSNTLLTSHAALASGQQLKSEGKSAQTSRIVHL